MILYYHIDTMVRTSEILKCGLPLNGANQRDTASLGMTYRSRFAGALWLAFTDLQVMLHVAVYLVARPYPQLGPVEITAFLILVFDGV
jgi:hypothetical protein